MNSNPHWLVKALRIVEKSCQLSVNTFRDRRKTSGIRRPDVQRQTAILERSIRSGRAKQSNTNSGFTLLEVLLTSLLASVVLVSLWSLSEIYLKLFVSGKQKIEETQLARGLTQQFAKDISQVLQLVVEEPTRNLGHRSLQFSSSQNIGAVSSTARQQSAANNPSDSEGIATGERMPPSPSQESGQTSSISEASRRLSEKSKPRFGLFGTKQALRLIVLETDPRTVRDPTDLAEFMPQPGQTRPPVASELRTIEYSFSGSRETNTSDHRHPPGLIRREWAWETWIGIKMANITPADSTGSSDMLPDNHAEWTAEDELALESEKSLFHVPQVMGLEFHYYDGEKWESEWNSWERRRLPLLVEVLLQIKVDKEELNTDSDEELSVETEGSLSLVDENASGDSSARSTNRGTVYRRLIHLPFAEAKPNTDSRSHENSTTDFARTSPQLRTNQP